MRIITQNGLRSLNFDQLDVFIEDGYICSTDGKIKAILGKYKNQERAIEVFNDMHNMYCQNIQMLSNVELPDLKEEFKKNSMFLVKATDETKIECYNQGNDMIYRMPKE